MVPPLPYYTLNDHKICRWCYHVVHLQYPLINGAPLSPTTPLMTTKYTDGAFKVETVKSAYSLVPLSAHQRNAIQWHFVGGPTVAPFYMLTVSLWFTYSTFVWLLCSVSSHMNHQHILSLEWCPLSPTTPLMTTSYIDGAIKVETAKSAYSLVPLSAHQRNAIEWRFAGGPIVAPFYMLTGSMWFTYSTFVRFFASMSSHMNHQHILGLERLLFPATLTPATYKSLLVGLDMVLIDML